MSKLSMICIILLTFLASFAIGGLTEKYILAEPDAGLLIDLNDSYQRKVDGFWVENVTKEKVKEISKKKDSYGDWINVNIRGMNFERAVEVCNHETGHEIFAEICERNITRCMDVVETLE